MPLDYDRAALGILAGAVATVVMLAGTAGAAAYQTGARVAFGPGVLESVR
jgi:hypothetical protein